MANFRDKTWLGIKTVKSKNGSRVGIIYENVGGDDTRFSFAHCLDPKLDIKEKSWEELQEIISSKGWSIFDL